MTKRSSRRAGRKRLRRNLNLVLDVINRAGRRMMCIRYGAGTNQRSFGKIEECELPPWASRHTTRAGPQPSEAAE